MRRVLRYAVPLFVFAAGLVAPSWAAEWAVDQENSKLTATFSVYGKDTTATFTDWTADIRFDPDNLAEAAIRVEVVTAALETGDKGWDRDAEKKAWFDVDAHPTAVFESTAVTSTGGNAYEAEGTLTIKGQSKPLTLPFTLDITGDTAKAAGSVEVLRLDWNVGKGTDEEAVPNGISVAFDLTAQKQ